MLTQGSLKLTEAVMLGDSLMNVNPFPTLGTGLRHKIRDDLPGMPEESSDLFNGHLAFATWS